MSQSLAILPAVSTGLVDEFGNGVVLNYAPAFFPVPAALDILPQSQWYIAQWGQPVPLNTAQYTTNNPSFADPVYGSVLYAWTAPQTTSSVAIYQNTAALGGGDVYQLTTANTTAPPSAGTTDEADMFLSSPAAGVSLANPITLSLNAKITQALIQFASQALASQYATSGAVFGTFDIGLTVNFDGAGGMPAYSGYVQIVPWTSDSAAPAGYESAPLPANADGSQQFVSSLLLPGDPSLSLLPSDAGALPDTLTYNLNKYVYATLTAAFSNFSPRQQAILLNLANWTLGGVYVGPATNDAQTSNGSATVNELNQTQPSSAGQTGGSATGVSEVANETVSIQLSNINATTDSSSYFNPSDPAVAGSKVDNNPQIAFYDNTIGSGGTADGSVYSGPLVGLDEKYLYAGADNISLTAPAGKNWEFGGGSGTNELTAVSGNNLFIASTGGSSMTGGSGKDIFDLPDPNATGIGTSNSIANFHFGDQVSLSGLAGPGWTYRWYDGLALNGQNSLTLLATSTLTPGLHELLTFMGLSRADLGTLQLTPAGSGSDTLLITRIRPQLQAVDLTSGVSSEKTSNATSNFVGIDAEYLYTGTDPVALTAPPGMNWAFGGGSAFSNLSAMNGNNVFIASTGGSNMQGGSGNDIFSIPDANVAGSSAWDSIANFHPGDEAMLAGLAGPGWNYSWTGMYGTQANPALTLEATSTMIPGLTETVMLNGLSMRDLPSLSISHGSGFDNNTLIIKC